MRRAKKKIANLLLGRRGHAGVIPQFYTAEKVYRVEGENGQQFIPVNQQVVMQDPIAGTVVKTLNDLSQGEFDIVISDIESSTTLRQAQLWSLVDAVSKLGIPADLVFESVIDLSDLPKKNDIKIRWQQQQQRQQQQQQERQFFDNHTAAVKTYKYLYETDLYPTPDEVTPYTIRTVDLLDFENIFAGIYDEINDRLY